MADQQILLIESPCHISIDTGRVLLKRADGHTRTELASDMAVLCLHHERISISHHALRTLNQANCVIISTDAQHMPCGIMLPLTSGASSIANTRLHDQIQLELSHEHKALIWQALVRQKIRNSALALRLLKLNGAVRLQRLAEQVQPDDAKNTEGHAAKHYWQQWFSHPNIIAHAQRRLKQNASDAVNLRLNYAYAILRALIARELVISGLTPALGVGHINRGNPFNLADDLIEPYRCIAECAVAGCDFEAEFIGIAKQNLIKRLMCEVTLTHEQTANRYRLPQAVAQTVQSYCRALSEHNSKAGASRELPSQIRLKLPLELFHEHQSN